MRRRPWEQNIWVWEFFGSSGALGRVRKTEELRLTGTQEPRALYIGVCADEYNGRVELIEVNQVSQDVASRPRELSFPGKCFYTVTAHAFTCPARSCRRAKRADYRPIFFIAEAFAGLSRIFIVARRQT